MLFAQLAAVLAASAAAAPVAAPAAAPVPLPVPVPATKKLDGYPEFNLVTEVQGQDGPDAGNLLISTFHTGAGLNAAIGTANSTIATPFILKDDLIQFIIQEEGGSGTEIQYAFGLPHVSAYMSNAPSSYNIVTISVLNHTTGFNLVNDYVEHPSSDFETFSMCYVNGTAPYQNLGPQYQLFWKDEASVHSADNCADVKLKAKYLDD